MILLIDHYDSFTYNLAQYLEELGEEVLVERYDTLSVARIQEMQPKAIVLSPGPGHPKDYVITQQIFNTFYKEIPFLGICLGHQLIGLCFGASVVSAPTIVHGKSSMLEHAVTREALGRVMRYHSLAVDASSLPHDLQAVSYAREDGALMELRHRSLPIVGMQYHPESIGTPDGRQRLSQFLQGVMPSESYL